MEDIVYYRGIKKVYNDGMLISRDCSKCKKHKNTSEFPKTKSKSYKDGILGQCNDCRYNYFKQYQNDNEESLKLYRQDYYQSNKNDILNKNKKYLEENRESILSKRKEWFDKNKDRVSEYRRNWCNANREKLNEYKKLHTSNRRAKIKNSQYMSVEDWNEILYCFEYQCPLTKSKDITIEHFIPISKGGETSVLNCYPLKSSLNYSKNNSNPFEWYEKKKDIIKEDDWLYLVSYLAEKNNMGIEEFKKHVNSFFDEEVTINE